MQENTYVLVKFVIYSNRNLQENSLRIPVWQFDVYSHRVKVSQIAEILAKQKQNVIYIWRQWKTVKNCLIVAKLTKLQIACTSRN